MPEVIKKLKKQVPSNLSPEEEEIRQRALEFRKSQGTEDVPEEAGIEEQDLEDVVPYGSTLSMVTPMGGLRKGMRKVMSEGAEHLGPKISRGLWQEAVIKPKVLKKISEEGVPAAEAALSAEKKAIRAAAQESRDIRQGLKKPGLGKEAKPFEGDYVQELAKDRQKSIQRMRSEGGDLSKAYEKPKLEEGPGRTLKKSDFTNPEYKRAVKELQDELGSLDRSTKEGKIRETEIMKELNNLRSVRSY